MAVYQFLNYFRGATLSSILNRNSERLPRSLLQGNFQTAFNRPIEYSS